MTRRTLTISIDANRVTCGKCRWANEFGGFALPRCELYDSSLLFDRNRKEGAPASDGWLRCAPCLAAEKREA